MTLNEAIDRAYVVWRANGMLDVQLRPDGGADVELLGELPRGIEFAYHRLDANGHAVCHRACADMEEERTR
jgi:hypothetical protein